MLRRLSTAVRVIVVPVLVAAACIACSGTSGGSGSSAGGDQLVWGKPSEAELLDPTVAAGATNWEILSLSYEGLVGLDDRLGVVPRLAESWKQTSPTSYVFTVRKGVKFSNGRELTPDDVAGSLRRLIDPKVAAAWAALVGIRDVSASGQQVTVTLTSPRTSLLAALAATQASVLPMKELNDGTFDPKKQLLGTGPYVQAAHSQGESWTFERNPHYWRPGVPKVDRLQIRIMRDDAARAAALRDGSIDVTTFENPDSTRLMEGVANVKTVVQATTDYYRLDVNARSSVFRDDRLRQALALAVDRNRIRDVALGKIGRPTAAASVAFDGACDPGAVPFAAPDLGKARELVAAAGATGTTVEIITPSAVPMAAPIAQVLQQSLQEAGLKVRITPAEAGVLIKRAWSGTSADFDIVVSWFAGYADPAMVLYYWNPAAGTFAKFWTKSDPQLNTAIDKSLSLPPGAERAQSLAQACDRIAQNANIIPLVSKDAIIAYRSDQLAAAPQAVEGYAVPLRNIAEFELK
jgi:peptide/nickel transport system substrate-binding protein